MGPLNVIAAQTHEEDLRRAHGRRWVSEALAAASREPEAMPVLAIRPAYPDEDQVVRDLAGLDDAPALKGSVLLALVDGRPVAGLSLEDGRVVANPFTPTQEAVALLRHRERQLSPAPKRRFGLARLRPRFV